MLSEDNVEVCFIEINFNFNHNFALVLARRGLLSEGNELAIEKQIGVFVCHV